MAEEAPPQVIGNPDAEALAPNALQRGNTSQQVDSIMKVRNKALMIGALQALLGLVIVALDYVGFTSKAWNEDYSSSCIAFLLESGSL